MSLNSVWVVWPLLGGISAVLFLIDQRKVLTRNNLFDTHGVYHDERNVVDCKKENGLNFRTPTGICNNKEIPIMGAKGIAFGRNVPEGYRDPNKTYSDISPEPEKGSADSYQTKMGIMEPNPLVISQELMARKFEMKTEMVNGKKVKTPLLDVAGNPVDKMVPAGIVNNIAAAWIQFMVHDWFAHGENAKKIDPKKVNRYIASKDVSAMEDPYDVDVPYSLELPPGTQQGVDFYGKYFSDKMASDGSIPMNKSSIDKEFHKRHMAGTSKGMTRKRYNMNTHWWDGSQLYGNSKAEVDAIRVAGRCEVKMKVEGKPYSDDPSVNPCINLKSGDTPKCIFPTRSELSNNTQPKHAHLPNTGFVENWWVGLELLHNVFSREHNVICNELRKAYPDILNNSKYAQLKTDSPEGTTKEDVYFGLARLITSALMAKIHTVEWTPAILQNPVLRLGMLANWWGLDDATKDWRERKDFQNTAEFREKAKKYNVDLSRYPKRGKFKRFLMRIMRKTALTSTKLLAKITPGSGGDLPLAIKGITRNQTQLHGVPFALTEEFVSVYRMHPLIRSDIPIYEVNTNELVKNYPIENTLGPRSEHVIKDHGFDQLWHSFGIVHPGALVLNNYPNFLRRLNNPNTSGTVDLAAMDIMRDRERGIPRYNQFRKLIHLTPIKTFEQLFQERISVGDKVNGYKVKFNRNDPLTAEEKKLVKKLKEIYNNDVNNMDLLIGCLAESVRPHGYGFGETAFQIFILMASRRLMGDRFFSVDYRPEVYTDVGFNWVEDNTMVDILRRHFPNLNSQFDQKGIMNAFVPWVEDQAVRYLVKVPE